MTVSQLKHFTFLKLILWCSVLVLGVGMNYVDASPMLVCLTEEQITLH